MCLCINTELPVDPLYIRNLRRYQKISTIFHSTQFRRECFCGNKCWQRKGKEMIKLFVPNTPYGITMGLEELGRLVCLYNHKIFNVTLI